MLKGRCIGRAAKAPSGGGTKYSKVVFSLTWRLSPWSMEMRFGVLGRALTRTSRRAQIARS